MKKYAVTDLRWASQDDFDLPIYRIKANQVSHGRDWKKIWEYPYLRTKIPTTSNCAVFGEDYDLTNFLKEGCHETINFINILSYDDNSFEYACSLSSLTNEDDIFRLLEKLVIITKYKLVVTLNITDTGNGLPRHCLRKLEDFLGVKIPNLPVRPFKPQIANENGRILAFTLEARENPRSVGILIPHWESWDFLQSCVETIESNKNACLDEHIYILDDSSKDGSYEKALEKFKDKENIEIHRIERPNKNVEADVGLLLDYGLSFVKEQYVTMIDADLFPISKEWIAFPIWLIEKFGCSSVGTDTGLSMAYTRFNKYNNSWSESKYEIGAGLYDNEWFTCTNNFYRVMPTSLAKVVSEAIGFTRGNLFKHDSNIPVYLRRRIQWLLTFVLKWNNRKPYMPVGCDNGVAANHFIDVNRMGPKFNLPITSYLGLTPKDGVFGQNVCGMVLHFALSTRALSRERREIAEAGKEFNYWVQRVGEAGGCTLDLISEMVNKTENMEYLYQEEGLSKFPYMAAAIPMFWYKREMGYIQELISLYKKEQL